MLKFDFNFLWTIINLILFFVLIRVFLFKPIKKVLDKRQEMIDTQLEIAENTKKTADELMLKHQTELDGVEEERRQILDDARTSGKNEYSKIVDRAHNDADRIRSDAKKAANLEVEKAKRAAKEEIAALAMETAQKVIGANSSAEIDSKLYDEFLSEGSDE
ncbi:MAG: F0F1 ATP synthase subunit B [Eubacterium sp.]|nr:F0F1 ATP synthase subunit B [Eubacterium sp.]